MRALALPTAAASAGAGRRSQQPAKSTLAKPASLARLQRAAYRARQGRVALATHASTAAPEGEVTERMSVPELKAALLDSFWGVERGLNASSDSRAEINELISQLEANNPTPLPNEAQGLLDGTWRLVYTANSEVLALLSLSQLPLVTVEDITQTVDGAAMTVENKVVLSGPLARTSFAANASVEVRSPKLLQVQFREGRLATPELLQDIVLPSSVEVLGQQVDLKPLQGVLQPLEGPLRGALSQLGDLLSRQADLQFPIRSPRASTWLLNTYLDEDLRITRGDGGSVYVLVKDTPGHDADYWAAPHDAVEAAAPAAPATPVVEPSAVIEEGELPGYNAGANGGAAPGSSGQA